MTSLNISLPDELKKVVDERVAQGNYASHSEYVRSLIRDDQQRAARERERVEETLLARLRAGESRPLADEDFERIRLRLRTSASGGRKRKTKARP